MRSAEPVTLIGEANDSIDRAHEGDACRMRVAKSDVNAPAQSGIIGKAGKYGTGELEHHPLAKSMCTATCLEADIFAFPGGEPLARRREECSA